MCGIFGFLGGFSSEKLQEASDTLYRRGPDSYGVFSEDAAHGKIGLAHRRLAIRDLSEAGHQPMLSSDSRYILSFNGEIYNRDKLALDLALSHLRGNSDTEVFLEACVKIGIEAALEKIEGMFAIAIYDRELSKLYLIRDRIGEKPLYVFSDGRGVVFASELKAIVQFLGPLEISSASLKNYLTFGCITGNHSIYKNLKKVYPGEYYSVISNKESVQISNFQYWSPPVYGQASSEIPSVQDIERRLTEVIDQQLCSDVPVGAFLSGGIDSTLVCTLIRKKLKKNISTFTVGLEDTSISEAKAASEIAAYLGTNHKELFVSSKECLSILADLPYIYDEPFSDSSQIPTLLLSKFAKNDVTVALSGDGGDEVFWGYNRYLFASKYSWMLKSSIINKFGSKLLTAMEPALAELGSYLLANKVTDVRGKIHKLASALGSGDLSNYYSGVVQKWSDEGFVELRERCHMASFSDLNRADFLWYLPDDIMVKVDRASMWQSLETRAPFLDHQLIEMAAKMPMSAHIQNGQGKLVLRRILQQYVPMELLDRPKSGFGVPLGSWLRGDLKNWAGDHIFSDWLWNQSVLDRKVVEKVWKAHQAGQVNREHDLWAIAILQQWASVWAR